MDTKTSYPVVITKTTCESSARFPIDSVNLDLRLPDWRPGKTPPRKQAEKELDTFRQIQQENLLELRASLVASINGIARETRLEKADSSALSTHSGDAGSDACDRDFVLSLLSQGTEALFEIDEALARIETGTYGTCEMSGRPIPVSRLKAIPFARFTVECQTKIEQGRVLRRPRAFPSPFSVADEERGLEAAERFL